VRTALSDYRRKRAELGLLQLDEGEIVALAREAGFEAGRHAHNLGHNPARLTIVATPVALPSATSAETRRQRYDGRETSAPIVSPSR